MKWISIKDRVPKNNNRVIICSMSAINDYGYPYNYTDACEMGFYEDGKWYSDTKFDILEEKIMKIFTRKKMTPIDAECWFCAPDVTHWMPLPKPPKEII
jgi:hypothetical protein